MNIALIGYGKMGKVIEQIALQRNHNISLIIDLENQHQFAKENFINVDVAIEFTTPHTAMDNLAKCAFIGVPVVCGTTGWYNKAEEIETLFEEHNGSLLYTSNFSIGVNLFFKINEYVAKLLSSQSQYSVSLQEIHHTQKKDAPSGTALSLANQILPFYPSKKSIVNTKTNDDNVLSIESLREDPAPGTHHIMYESIEDSIQITHTAHNRNGFALGAVLAAEYIYDKKGIFTMQNVLNI
jgi:4-hydroxy-tetrahydrodipicolinate reductase